MEVDNCAAVTHNSPSSLSSSTKTNLLTSYRGLFVCSSYIKDCLIQLCDASLACFFGSAPSARKKTTKKKTYPYISAVHRGIYREYRQPKCRCSECSTQRVSWNSPQRLTLMFPAPIDHSFLLCQGPRKRKRKSSTAKGSYTFSEEKRKATLTPDEEKLFHCFFFVRCRPFSSLSQPCAHIRSSLI